MYYFQLFVLNLIPQIATSYLPYPTPAFAGIETHLAKLTAAEANEIRDFCSNSGLRQPQNRIIGGAKVGGVVPYAAVFVSNGLAQCGATFISTRHLLSARHCFKKLEQSGAVYRLLAGGTCLRDSPHCEATTDGKADMVELEFELIIYDERDVEDMSATSTDFAIIQLKNAIPSELRDRIEFACLPSKDAKLPAIVTVNGWGMIVDSNSVSALIPALKQINLTVESAPPTTSSAAENCQPAWNSFCANPLRLGERSAQGWLPFDHMPFSGDSGSGAVRLAQRDRRAVLYGILSMDRRSHANIHVVFVDLRKFLDDLCLQLSLCAKGAVAKMVNFRPTALYFSRRDQSHFGQSAFQSIQSFQDDEYRRKCDEQRTSKTFPPRIGWAAAVVDAFGDFVCAATFVTRRHLVTTRSCFTDRIFARIQKGHFKSYRDAFFVAAGGACLANPNNASAGNCDASSADTTVQMDVGLVAWTSAHRGDWLADIAIIELRRDNFMPNSSSRVFPACINTDLDSVWRNEAMLHAYAWSGTDTVNEDDKRNLLRRVMKVDLWHTENRQLYYTDTTSTTGALPQAMTPHDQGTALVDPESGEMAGVFLKTDSAYDMYNIVYPAEYLEDLLCIYLNRCARKKNFYSLTPFHRLDIIVQPFINLSNTAFNDF